MLMKMKNVINWFIFFFTLKDTIRTITSGRRKVSSDVLVMGKISKIFFPIMVMIGGGVLWCWCEKHKYSRAKFLNNSLNVR